MRVERRRAKGLSPEKVNDRTNAMMDDVYGSDPGDGAATDTDDTASEAADDTVETGTDSDSKTVAPRAQANSASPQVGGKSAVAAAEQPEDDDIQQVITALEAELADYRGELEKKEKDYRHVQSFADRRGTEVAEAKQELERVKAELQQAIAYNLEWQNWAKQQQAQQQAQSQQPFAQTDDDDEGGYADPVARKQNAELRNQMAQLQGLLSQTQEQLRAQAQLVEAQRRTQEAENTSRTIENWLTQKQAVWRNDGVRNAEAIEAATLLLRQAVSQNDNTLMERAESLIRKAAIADTAKRVRSREDAAAEQDFVAEDNAGMGSRKTTSKPKPKGKGKEDDMPDYRSLKNASARHEARTQGMLDSIGWK